MASDDYDYLFKILIIGDSGVGKTSILLRYVDDRYSPMHDFTIGVDFRTKIIDFNGKRAKLYIWDTSGQERFRAITASYYRGAQGILLVYDVTNQKSFHDIKQWLQEAETHGSSKVAKVLVGNKCDLTKNKEVDTETGHKLSAQLRIPFIETSTKDSLRIQDMFLTLCEEVKRMQGAELEALARRKSGVTTVSQQEKKDSCAC